MVQLMQFAYINFYYMKLCLGVFTLHDVIYYNVAQKMAKSWPFHAKNVILINVM